jgi:hypothetical protein
MHARATNARAAHRRRVGVELDFGLSGGAAGTSEHLGDTIFLPGPATWEPGAGGVPTHPIRQTQKLCLPSAAGTCGRAK